jgi:hypothetical protein
MTHAKAFRTFIILYSVFKIRRLSGNIKLKLHTGVNEISNGLWLFRLGISGKHLTLKIAAPIKQGLLHHWKFSKVHTDPQFAQGFQPSPCLLLYNKIVQSTNRSHTNHEKEHVRCKGKVEASIENIRGLYLAVLKLTTVQVTKLPLYHIIRKVGMNCFVKPLLTEDFSIV